MYLGEIGDIIAVRELSLAGSDESSASIKIFLGKPNVLPDGGGYYCPFQIVGVGAEDIKYAAGVDPIQSLQLAMVMIGATLQFLNEGLDGELRWEGGGEGDLGFPLSLGSEPKNPTH